MAEASRVPPSVSAALDYLEWARLIQQGDGTLPGRDLLPEEHATRKAALALLLGYFKRVDPTAEGTSGGGAAASGGDAGARDPVET